MTKRSVPLPVTLPGEGTPVTGPLDEQFARLMVRLHGEPHELLEEAARMVSAWRAAGHPCMPLSALADPGKAPAKRLLATAVVGTPGEWKPLVLDAAGRLYLHRYWKYERDLAGSIRARAEASPPKIDAALLLQGLDELFTLNQVPGHTGADQRRAAEQAVRGHFSVITGGPGTGKTRTVAGILALLHAQDPGTRFALAAPTGKAAARLTEAITAALDNYPARDAIPVATTLDRLLGTTPDSPLPRFTAAVPLAVDVVVVDEASMVGLAMMAKLFAAVPPTARLILLGDRDQLASVEPGHVLGDICGGVTASTDLFAPAGGLSDRIVELRENFRFAKGSAIGEVSALVQRGKVEEVLTMLRENAAPDLHARTLPEPGGLRSALHKLVESAWAPMLRAPTPALALAAMSSFRLLCAVRRGPWGVEHLNRQCEGALADAGLLKPGPAHYRGRPVLITRNDPALGLFNGDTGIILPDAESGGDFRAFFPALDGTVRRLLPHRLPPHETCWAMTVHKSQGSEWNEVLLVLPERDSPVLGRELIYTALTRARRRIELWSHAPTLRVALGRKVERSSGLRDALWGRDAEVGA